MEFALVPLTADDVKQFKTDIQEAFQKGFEEKFGESDVLVLPEKDIDHSLHAEGAAAYKAIVDNDMVGGAIVIIDSKTHHNHLDLLYVKCGIQSKGIGKAIWDTIEKLYPETLIWETCTPYFDRRNIHFYVNRCGFHIVEFFNERHPEPDAPEDFIGDGNEGMFLFRKQM